LTCSTVSVPRLVQLAALIERRLGLWFPERRLDELRRYLDTMRRNESVADVEAFVTDAVRTSGADLDWRRLARYLTVGETYFFRDRGAMTALTNHVLPELIARGRARGRQLRIWSAGCGTGEEVYTLAILLRRLVPDLAKWRIDLLGTDVNDRSLAAAAEARYRLWSFRDTPDWVRTAYFEQTADGRFALADDVKDLVRLEHHNLADEPWSPALVGQMDLILCRNVLMYFARERIRAVAERFHECLVPDGYLIVSPSELGSDGFRRFALRNFEPGFAFRKSEAAALPETARDGPTARRPRATRRDREQPAPVPLRAPPPPTTEFPALPEEAKEPEDGLARALDALAERPMDPGAHYVHAAVLEELGRLGEADDALRRALYLDPDFALAHFMRGHVLVRLRRHKAAFRHFAAAARLADGLPPDVEVEHAGGMTGRMLCDVIATSAAGLRSTT